MSVTDPTTFCTLAILEHFHCLTLQSNITAYDYYMTLQAMTNVTGLNKQYVSPAALNYINDLLTAITFLRSAKTLPLYCTRVEVLEITQMCRLGIYSKWYQEHWAW